MSLRRAFAVLGQAGPAWAGGHGSGSKSRADERMLRVSLGGTVHPPPDSPQPGHRLS